MGCLRIGSVSDRSVNRDGASNGLLVELCLFLWHVLPSRVFPSSPFTCYGIKILLVDPNGLRMYKFESWHLDIGPSIVSKTRSSRFQLSLPAAYSSIPTLSWRHGSGNCAQSADELKWTLSTESELKRAEIDVSFLQKQLHERTKRIVPKKPDISASF